MADSDITREDLPDFGALFDNETMERMERAASSKGAAQQRRLALVVCARDSDTLIKLAKQSPEAFEEMAVMIDEYRVHAETVLELANAAHSRMCVAGVAALDRDA